MHQSSTTPLFSLFRTVFNKLIRNRDSVVIVATSLWLDDARFESQQGQEIFFLFQHVQTASGVQPTSYLMNSVVPSRRSSGQSKIERS
jgi:hypothetical protein